MSIAAVVTRGYGSFGSISLVVTRGYIAGVTPPVTADLGGRYRRIPLKRRKKREEELEELQRFLEAVAKDAPKPELKPYVPVAYRGPIAAQFFPEQVNQRTAPSVAQIMAQAKARAEIERIKRQQDEDDDAAALLLLS